MDCITADMKNTLELSSSIQTLQLGESTDEYKGVSLTELKKGQQITGVVTAIGDEILFRLGGQDVAAPRELYQDAVLGDIKVFEVLRVTGNKVELGVVEKVEADCSNSFASIVRLDTDRGVFLSRKVLQDKQADREYKLQETKNKIDKILLKMTQEDYQALEKEGFPVEEFTMEGLDAALERVKMLKSTRENVGQAETGTEDNKKNSKNNQITEKEIRMKLEEYNLPATKDSIQKVSVALVLSEAITKMDEKAFKILIQKEQPATIENIYRAQYSSSAPLDLQKLSEKAWKELEPQIKEVLENTEFELSKENIESAKWLIENQLPLTEENFQYLSRLKDLKNTTDKNEILNKILLGISKGIEPKDITLLPENTTSVEKIIKDIQTISDDAILQVVKESKLVTIKSLVSMDLRTDVDPGNKDRITFYYNDKAGNRVKSSAESYDDKARRSIVGKTEDKLIHTETVDRYVQDKMLRDEDKLSTLKEIETEEEIEGPTIVQKNKFKELTNDQQLEAIRAQRQLEEIRLKMTVEAAYRLEKKGFHIETQGLEKVVEELRSQEDHYYQNLFAEAEMNADEENIRVLKSAVTGMEQLKQIPSYVLGTTLSDRKLHTVPKLLEEGSQILSDLNRAKEAYETLMTIPIKEYGDSLQKAFLHSESLLREMGIENTELNRRAVRILGYNHMEITEEAIEQVKAYDLEVNDLIHNLHPAVAVRMIKDGLNPMELPIGELNEKVAQIKKEQGISEEEKFSVFLRKLEKDNAISDRERKAYIGIYRLLHRIEKSDGAALGAVIKADQEVTLSHLLTAVRTYHKGNLDARVDDNFGILQSVSFERESISEQISNVHPNSNGNVEGNYNHQNQMMEMEEKIDIMNSLMRRLSEEVSPTKLNELQQSFAEPSQSWMPTPTDYPPLEGVGDGIWEKIKDVPIERLFDKINQIQEAELEEEPIYLQKLQEMRNGLKNADQALRFLDDFKIPCTTVNVTLAGQMIANGGTLFKKLHRLKNENKKENSKNDLKELSELADTLIDKNSVNETYEKLEQEVTAVVEQEIQSDRINLNRIAELKGLRMQMALMKNLAKKEFYQIPIGTDKEVTHMNLTVVRGSGVSGKVAITYQSELLGRVKADLVLKENLLSGYIACDNRNGMDALRKNLKVVEDVLEEDRIVIKQLDLCMQRMGNETYSYQNMERDEIKNNPEEERRLYRIARGMVLTLQAAEKAENEGSEAAS